MSVYSANLGFLWTDVSLPEAVAKAAAAGFVAVECHWPYDTPAADLRAALDKNGLKLLGVNTLRGDTDKGENGLAALTGRETEAKASISQALDYARESGAGAVHVMAGFASGQAARETFVANLKFACAEAAGSDIKILIEPLNHYDAPGYFLSTTSQAVALIEEINQPDLKLMFDCYHVQLMEGDLTNRFQKVLPHIGHVQFASVPDRGPPDSGEINYRYLFTMMAESGYSAPLGAEYKPVGATDDSLGWLENL